MARPSAPLIRLIRDISRKKGLNTAALAKKAGLDRSRLKHVLGGSEAMTVDELLLIGQALELDPKELGMAELDEPPEEIEREPGPALADENGEWTVDPFGNHAEQALRLGFGMGCDMFLWLEREHLDGSGVPDSVMSQYDDTVPIRLDAAYHRHYSPDFQDWGVSMTLSFGTTLHNVRFPWFAFRQVALIPLAPDPIGEDDDDKPQPEGPGKGHLRLVE